MGNAVVMVAAPATAMTMVARVGNSFELMMIPSIEVDVSGHGGASGDPVLSSLGESCASNRLIDWG